MATKADKQASDQPHGPPDESLRAGLEILAERDPSLAIAYQRCGLPPERSIETGFPGLLRIIISQQVSVASARAIITRLEERASPLSPEGFLALSDEELKAIGFSRMKMVYGRNLAEKVQDGRLDFRDLHEAPNQMVIERLTAIKGIGRWTAEVYLLFAMKREDVWPAGDLALIKALQQLRDLPNRPSEAESREITALWRPYRSLGARFLWHYYRHQGLA